MRLALSLLASIALLFGASTATLIVTFERSSRATGKEIQTVLSTLGVTVVRIRGEDGAVTRYGGSDRKLENTEKAESKMLRGEEESHRKLCRLGPNCVKRHGATICGLYPGCLRQLSVASDMESMAPSDVEVQAMKAMGKAGRKVSFSITDSVDVAYLSSD